MTADRPAGARSGHRILIVDDHEPTVRMLADVVRHWSGADVRTTTDSRRVLSMFRDFEPDMLLLDLHMPGLDGVDLIRQVTTRLPDGEYLPIVVFSGDTSADARRSALATGASDFIAKPIVVPEVTLRLGNLLRLRDLTCRLEAEVRARTRDLEAAELDVANRLARVAEYRDYPDGAHVQRVGRLSALIAARLDRPETEVALLRFAAPLHDIGKVAIPDAVILKPARLTPAEMEVIRSHTTIGARTLAGSRSPILQMAEEIALYHHENWDGTGYTPDLAGEDIPLVGRIVSVADVFDALTHVRPYKPPWSPDQALAWMQSMRGRKFDPAVLDGLVAVLGETPLPAGLDAILEGAGRPAGDGREPACPAPDAAQARAVAPDGSPWTRLTDPVRA